MPTVSGPGLTATPPTPRPDIAHQIWVECGACGWKSWLDVLITNVSVDYEPRHPPRLTIEAMFDGAMPKDLFAVHRCEP